MDPATLDPILRASLRDGHLSAGEADAVLAWVRDARSSSARTVARGRAFALAKSALATHEPAAVLTWLESASAIFESPPGHGAPSRACFSPGDDCLNRVISRLQAADKSADVCVFTITDNRISRALDAAHRRGVSVRIITDNDKANDLGSDIAQLAGAGVPVKVDRTPYHMHHKFAIIDGAYLLNGSYNWTRSAADQNEENLVETGETALIAQFQAKFDELWAKL